MLFLLRIPCCCQRRSLFPRPYRVKFQISNGSKSPWVESNETVIYGDPERAPGRAGAPPPRLDVRFTNLNLEKVKKSDSLRSDEVLIHAEEKLKEFSI